MKDNADIHYITPANIISDMKERSQLEREKHHWENALWSCHNDATELTRSRDPHDVVTLWAFRRRKLTRKTNQRGIKCDFPTSGDVVQFVAPAEIKGVTVMSIRLPNRAVAIVSLTRLDNFAERHNPEY